MANKIDTTLAAVNGGQDLVILTGKSDWNGYDSNGKRIGDKPLGVKLNVALQGNRLAALTVKLNADPFPEISDEEIAAACAAYKFAYVRLTNCKVGLYNMNGSIGMTATATDAELLDTTKASK